MRLQELLEEGDLDEALRELRWLEVEAEADDTNSVLMTANLERMRLRERQQELSADQLKADKVKLTARILSIAQSLEGEIDKARNDRPQTKRCENVVVLEQQREHALRRPAIWHRFLVRKVVFRDRNGLRCSLHVAVHAGFLRCLPAI